jgi:hypothetical protein
MKSIAKALDNIAIAIRNLASLVAPVKAEEIKIPPTTITSNPVKSNVTITSITPVKSSKDYPFKDSQFPIPSATLVHVTKAERDAIQSIYNIINDKGSHPDHHDHVMRELSTKWPLLHKALLQLVKARKEGYNQQYNNPWKTKEKW